jgi:hypothetical protein
LQPKQARECTSNAIHDGTSRRAPLAGSASSPYHRFGRPDFGSLATSDAVPYWLHGAHRRLTVVLLIAASLLVSSCGGGNSSSPAPGSSKQPSLSSISVTPSSPLLYKIETRQFVARGTLSDGSSSDITASVLWSTSDPKIAQVHSDGIVLAEAAGNVTISATSGNIVGSTTVTVTLKPAFVYVATTQHSGQSNPLPITYFSLGPRLELDPGGTFDVITFGKTFLALHPSNQFLYLGGAGDPAGGSAPALCSNNPSATAAFPSLIALSINQSTGQPAFSSPFDHTICLSQPTSSLDRLAMVFHPNGKFLYVVNESGGISMFSIDTSAGSKVCRRWLVLHSRFLVMTGWLASQENLSTYPRMILADLRCSRSSWTPLPARQPAKLLFRHSSPQPSMFSWIQQASSSSWRMSLREAVSGSIRLMLLRESLLKSPSRWLRECWPSTPKGSTLPPPLIQRLRFGDLTPQACR